MREGLIGSLFGATPSALILIGFLHHALTVAIDCPALRA
jgi:hypothetical protein